VALSRQRGYYKVVHQAVAALNSSASVKEKLEAIVKAIARAMKVGTSLALLLTKCFFLSLLEKRRVGFKLA